MQKTASYTKTRFRNIYKTESGTYRARKTFTGRTMSKTFRTLKDARLWLNKL